MKNLAELREQLQHDIDTLCNGGWLNALCDEEIDVFITVLDQMIVDRFKEYEQ